MLMRHRRCTNGWMQFARLFNVMAQMAEGGAGESAGAKHAPPVAPRPVVPNVAPAPYIPSSTPYVPSVYVPPAPAAVQPPLYTGNPVVRFLASSAHVSCSVV